MTGRSHAIEKVVIVGGGTAGWMTAAALARYLDDGRRSITLVESDDIATVGVGEATIPSLLGFNRHLGIDEAKFVAETKATFKLGIEFVDWGNLEDRYFHPFGTIGRDLQGVAFHQFWLKHRAREEIGALTDYSMASVAAHAGRFLPNSADPRSPLHDLAYAYHFDAGLYARFLRGYAEEQGARRIEGMVSSVDRDALTGFVTALNLADGRRIEGELFIDCSGFRSLLLGQKLGIGYQDWSHWLPCDRAVAMASARTEPLLPFTRATARGDGWQWRIPLQHRTGNGYVYCSTYCSDEQGEEILRTNLDGEALGDARVLRFKAGMRERFWERNVIAIGLSGGFIEPLESTSIHLVQHAISKLLWLFPDNRFSDVERTEFNRTIAAQFEGIRDFIILHYIATNRSDTPFWRGMHAAELPSSLQHKIALFREKGRIIRYGDELFDIPSWVSVMVGQNILPEGYDPVVDAMDQERVIEAMRTMRQVNAAAASGMPDHDQYIRRLVNRDGGVAHG